MLQLLIIVTLLAPAVAQARGSNLESVPLTINSARSSVVTFSPSGQVSTTLTSLFPSVDAATLNSFSTSGVGGGSNSLTANPLYKDLMTRCRVFGAPASCDGISAFGTVNGSTAQESLKSLNRMVVINPSGARRYEDIAVSNGVMSFNQSQVRETEIAFIDVGYYRGSLGTPFHRCDAEMVVCGSKVTGCPAAQGSATCSPVVAGNTFVNANCSCGANQILTKCENNVPTCSTGSCPTGEVRLPNGSCAKDHVCSEYASTLSNVCAGTFQTYTAPSNSPLLYPATISCEGTKTCAPTSTNACALSIVLSNVTQPTNATALDGVIGATTTGGTGAVTYSLSPGAPSNTSGNYSNLMAGVYTVSATDSATPTACTSRVSITLAPIAPTSCVTTGANDCAFYAPNYCPGTPFIDGCNRACSNGTKTVGCTSPAPIKCPDTILVGAGAIPIDPPSSGSSGYSLGNLVESIPGTVLTLNSKMGGQYSDPGQLTNRSDTQINYTCQANGAWLQNQGSTSVGPYYTCPVYASSAYNLPGAAIYYFQGQGPLNNCVLMPSSNGVSTTSTFSSPGPQGIGAATWQKVNSGSCTTFAGNSHTIGTSCVRSDQTTGTTYGYRLDYYTVMGLSSSNNTYADGMEWQPDAGLDSKTLCICR